MIDEAEAGPAAPARPTTPLPARSGESRSRQAPALLIIQARGRRSVRHGRGHPKRTFPPAGLHCPSLGPRRPPKRRAPKAGRSRATRRWLPPKSGATRAVASRARRPRRSRARPSPPRPTARSPATPQVAGQGESGCDATKLGPRRRRSLSSRNSSRARRTRLGQPGASSRGLSARPRARRGTSSTWPILLKRFDVPMGRGAIATDARIEPLGNHATGAIDRRSRGPAPRREPGEQPVRGPRLDAR